MNPVSTRLSTKKLSSPIPTVHGSLDVPDYTQLQDFSQHTALHHMQLPSTSPMANHIHASSPDFPRMPNFHNAGRSERLSSMPSVATTTLESTHNEGSQKLHSMSSTTSIKKAESRKIRAYSFDDSIREFRPDKLYQNKESKRRDSYMVHGVNILNRDNVDSETAMNRLRKRREQHNRVERRRRDLINSSIEELSEIVPQAKLDGVKFARGNVLQLTIDFIKELQQEVKTLRMENEKLRRSSLDQVSRTVPTTCPPTIVINQPEILSVNTSTPSPSSGGWESDIKTPTDSQEFLLTGSSHSGQLSSPITSPIPSPSHYPIYSHSHTSTHSSSFTHENSTLLPHSSLPQIVLTIPSPLPFSPSPSTGYTLSQAPRR